VRPNLTIYTTLLCDVAQRGWFVTGGPVYAEAPEKASGVALGVKRGNWRQLEAIRGARRCAEAGRGRLHGGGMSLGEGRGGCAR